MSCYYKCVIGQSYLLYVMLLYVCYGSGLSSSDNHYNQTLLPANAMTVFADEPDLHGRYE